MAPTGVGTFQVSNEKRQPNGCLGGGFKHFLFSPLPGEMEMVQFDEHIFQMGWFNHQPVVDRGFWLGMKFTTPSNVWIIVVDR